MKDGLRDIIGKQIVAVAVDHGDRSPRSQVFLAFSDGTTFEFDGADFTCAGSLDRTTDVERYVESGNGRIVSVYGNPLALAPPATLSTGREKAPYAGAVPEASLENLLQRDLDAWIAAKAAVER